MTADTEAVEALQDCIETEPDTEITVDVETGAVEYGETTVDASVDSTQRRALVAGEWDTTAMLGANPEEVAETAASLPYVD